MRLLVTRPEPDATETAERLKALGHEAVVAPLLTIVIVPPPEKIPEPGAIILTSRNGLRALSTWPRKAGWLARPVFATGIATAKAARGAGFTDVRTAAGDGTDLARALMAELGKGVGPILHVAARDRSAALTDALSAGGYGIHTVEAYRAEMATAIDPDVSDALRSHMIDGVLLYSHRTALAFHSICDSEGLAKHLGGTVLFALSERIAAPLRDLGAEIRVAREPHETSLFALLPRP